MISNQDFLAAIFGGRSGDAHVTGFREDPGELEKLGLRRYWGGCRAASRIPAADENGYFTISLFKDDPESGKARRRKDLFEATHCIVVDDVGTKVQDTSRLGAPSWKLLTSPGNEQWGYILTAPETDAARVNALLDGMVATGLSVDGRDPGMKGVTRYVRLPVSRNTKAKYGSGGFSCRLTHWEPSRRTGIEALAAAFGITLPAAGAGAPGGRPRCAAVDAQSDPIFACLDRWGMVDGSRTGDGGWNITCPWVDEHTQGVDSGTAYWAGGGFKCHHGHCENKGRGELRQWVDERLRAEGEPSLTAAEFLACDAATARLIWVQLAHAWQVGAPNPAAALSDADVRSLAAINPGVADLCIFWGLRALMGVNTGPLRNRVAAARRKATRDAQWISAGKPRAAKARTKPKAVTLPQGYQAPMPLAHSAAQLHAALNGPLRSGSTPP